MVLLSVRQAHEFPVAAAIIVTYLATLHSTHLLSHDSGGQKSTLSLPGSQPRYQ